MSRNHEVTCDDYARCVKQQIAFLLDVGPDTIGLPGVDLIEFYTNGVSVDAAAQAIVYSGWAVSA